MSSSFLGFIASDFDTYLPKKWASNAFNRERLAVREKLEGLGRILNPFLSAEDGSLLAYHVSAEHPAIWNQHRVENQHLFFCRNDEATKHLETIISKKRSMASLIEDPSPLRNHIFLSLMVDQNSIEIALKLHSDAAVDRDNFQRKCDEFFRREKILAMFQALPEVYEMGIAGQDLFLALGCTDERLAQITQSLPQAESWFVVRQAWSRETCVGAGASFVDQAKGAFVELLPILNQLAWSRDNDFVSMRETLREQEVKQRSKGLAKNDRVRVVRGIFAGKMGVVQEIDGKGSLKVLLGHMAVKLGGEDVTPV